MSIRLTKHQVISLRKSVKRSKLVGSFKDGFTIPRKNTSRFLLIWVLEDPWIIQTNQTNVQYGFLYAVLVVIYELGCCFEQCVAVFLLVSPT